MPVLLLKSLLSLLLLLLALIGMYTMFEVFGRKERRFGVPALKRVHRWNGYLFLLLFLVIGALCLDLLVTTRMALGSRLMFHVVLALAVLLLLLTKIAYVRVYTLFYPQVRVFGLLIGLLAVGLVAISGGYYLLMTGFSTRAGAAHVDHNQGNGEGTAPRLARKTDTASIARGRALYREQCIHCHDPHSREPKLGPGHQGILRREKLPVSGRPATPENVASQLREPYRAMPAFTELTRNEVEDLIAYLETL